MVDSDSDSNPDSDFWSPITTLIGIGIDLHIVKLTYIGCVGFESRFGFKAVGFGFGFKKIKMDSDSCGFGFETGGFGSGFGFEVPGFAHHCTEAYGKGALALHE